MIVEINNFLDEKFCDEIIKSCSANIDKNNSISGYNREGNTVVFKDHEKLKDLDNKIFEKINSIISNKLRYTFSLPLNIKDTGYSFHRYEKKDKLYTHSDNVFDVTDDFFYPRVLSIVVNLTNNENANLIFPKHDKTIKSEKGKLIAFLPHNCYEHYMNNNSNKNRDILVTWLVDTSIECRKAVNG